MIFDLQKERGATIMYYAIKENNFDLLKSLLETKQNVLAEYMSDELDVNILFILSFLLKLSLKIYILLKIDRLSSIFYCIRVEIRRKLS
jgi:hypothetical protein